LSPPARSDTADLRPEFARLKLPIRRQGARGTCSVFTMTGAIEFGASKRLGRAVVLSPEFLNWAANKTMGHAHDGQFFSSIQKGFERYGACLESEMPYADAFHVEYEPSARALKSADGLRSLGLRVRWIMPNTGKAGVSDDHMLAMKGALKSGLPVCAGSYHSLLAVAFADDPAQAGGGVFTLRDSGSGREVTMTYEEARTRLCDLLVVEWAPASSGDQERAIRWSSRRAHPSPVVE